MSDMSDMSDLIEDAQEAVHTDAGSERLAALALRLSAIHKASQGALGPLKEKLREIAREKRSGSNKIQIEARESGESLGFVLVTFPNPRVRVSGDADMRQLEQQLGDSFGSLFERVVTYRPVKGFEDLVLSREDLAPALTVVEMVDPTPRVSFKPSLIGGVL